MPEQPKVPVEPEGIEMPQPTAAPMILAVGIVLIGAGVVLSLAFLVVGVGIFVVGLAVWIGDLLPGRGHLHEPRVQPERRPRAITAAPGTVTHMQADMPGYRLRLPSKVHPISAGIKGGLAGGILMPIPALLWGLLSGHGIWYPINLLVGIGIAGVDSMPLAELEQFHLSMLLRGLILHAAMSLVIGLIYGVVLPALPSIRGGQLVWGGVLLPLFWTGVSYGLMGVVNPLLQREVDWPWFIASQFVFGITAALVVIRTEQIAVPPAGTGPDTEPLTS